MDCATVGKRLSTAAAEAALKLHEAASRQLRGGGEACGVGVERGAGAFARFAPADEQRFASHWAAAQQLA